MEEWLPSRPIKRTLSSESIKWLKPLASRLDHDRPHDDRLKQLYLVERWSARRISDGMGCSHSTVLCKLKKQGVLISKEDSSEQRLEQIGYSKRMINGCQVRNQTEVRTIEKLKQLREDGFSYNKIATIFNSMGVPTKRRGAKWHATTVMNILNTI